jgi:hypothetical protein
MNTDTQPLSEFNFTKKFTWQSRLDRRAAYAAIGECECVDELNGALTEVRAFGNDENDIIQMIENRIADLSA